MAGSHVVCCLFAVIFIFCFGDVTSGSFCPGNSRYYHYQKYCTYGCCGTFNEYCCTGNVGLIIGCVFGGIAVLCLIIALICCFIKKQSYAGRVVRPGNVTNANRSGTVLSVVYSSQSSHPYYGIKQSMAPAQPPQPPPYMGQDQIPPPYTYTAPAYPPGAGPYNQPPPPAFNVPVSANSQQQGASSAPPLNTFKPQN